MEYVYTVCSVNLNYFAGVTSHLGCRYRGILAALEQLLAALTEDRLTLIIIVHLHQIMNIIISTITFLSLNFQEQLLFSKFNNFLNNRQRIIGKINRMRGLLFYFLFCFSQN